MENRKKTLVLLTLTTLTLLMISVGVSWAFFNYVWTGKANVFETGDIVFESDYTSVTLENVFPIEKANLLTDTENVVTINVSIKGYTTYDQGVDYRISAKSVNLQIGDKMVPISANVTSQDIPNIQTINYEDEMSVVENSVFAQGSIFPKDGSVDGVVTLKFYISGSNMVISDTYDGTESDEMGTTNDEVNGRIVFTSEEWNNLESNGGVSLKIKVEAWEHEETLYDVMLASAVMDNISSDFVTSSTGINFGEISSDENGKGLYMRAGTENDTYPIVYYRGDVQDNNVVFGGFCWKAVRTTETGGVKLIYNGVYENEVCSNTGDASILKTHTAFNSSSNSPTYVGYMYGTVYEIKSGLADDGVYYGTGFNYENGVYTLKTIGTTLDATHHYTCNSTSETGSCETIRYYFYAKDDVYSYIELTDGKGAKEAISEIQANNVESTVKKAIDEWYKANMTNYTSYLEDTPWCNDKDIYSLGGWNPDGGNLTSILNYASYELRSNANPKTSCDKKYSFTVNESDIGNGLLTYPVALLTADEVMLAGGVYGTATNSYLGIGQYWWTLSPYVFNASNSAFEYYVNSANEWSSYTTGSAAGVRPSISIASRISILDGDGTANNPYVISY